MTARSSFTATTTSTACAAPASCGRAFGWPGPSTVEYYIPHRVEEGYGVNAEALRKLAVEHKAELIVTVDCGISAVREAELARELGVELIVTDHHTIGSTLAAGRRDRAPAFAGRPCSTEPTFAGRRSRSSWPGKSARALATGNGPRRTPRIPEARHRAWSRWRRSPTWSRSRTRIA